MKLIPLTQGKFAQVDNEDYDFLMQWKWFAWKHKNHHTYYAVRSYIEKGKRKTMFMHRLICDVVNKKVLIDHKNRNGLNNQKNNLRNASHTQNNTNTTSRRNSTSSFLGVSLQSRKYKKSVYNRWCAVITINKKTVRLGQFPYIPEGEILAALVYDEAAKKYFGEFANLNFKS